MRKLLDSLSLEHEIPAHVIPSYYDPRSVKWRVKAPHGVASVWVTCSIVFIRIEEGHHHSWIVLMFSINQIRIIKKDGVLDMLAKGMFQIFFSLLSF